MGETKETEAADPPTPLGTCVLENTGPIVMLSTREDEGGNHGGGWSSRHREPRGETGHSLPRAQQRWVYTILRA